MTKKEFADVVQNKLDGYTKKQCETIIDAFTDAVAEVLASGDEIRLTNFGTFKMRQVKAYENINISTRTRTHFKSRKTPILKFSPRFKDAVINSDANADRVTTCKQ